MDNMEYIKSLEARIEALEKFINSIMLSKNNDITFENCNIQGLGIQNCKNVSLSNVQADGLGYVALKSEIKDSTFNQLKNEKGKIKLSHCTINNTEI